jgi:hypothetical protein
MKHLAYWISPRGELAPVEGTALKHIDLVWRNPTFFGLNRNVLLAVYEKHQERAGQEGKARQELMAELLRKDWIRIRYVPKIHGFTVQTGSYGARKRRLLKAWARMVTGGGLDTLDGRSLYLSISTARPRDTWQGSIHEFLRTGPAVTTTKLNLQVVHLAKEE